MDKLKTAIIGATGVVGQQFVIALQHHPWFEITRIAASERSAEKAYREALNDERTKAFRWFCDETPDDYILDMKVEDAAELDVEHLDIVFSAVESEVAEKIEPMFAKTTPVISTARAFRYEEDVPIIIPGVNSEQAEILNIQRKKRGWKGFISPQPNCTSTGLAITLKPIYDSFGIDYVIMTSLQAVSGAGRSPGVIALDILNNVIPYIPREEEAVQSEVLKILGKYDNGRINPANIKLSCTCTRVDVTDGHTESVFVDTTRSCTVDDAKKAFSNFGKSLINLKLPSAPLNMIVVNDDPFRPQPRLDRNTQDGMATTVGRIRKDNVFVKGIKYVLVSHNTKMGAAKGAVLVAEYLNKEGYI